MSRATPDDQLKFLLSCVRHSNNGKIDFVEVARECGVVSKGAAAKRYERLLKANGIHPSGGTTERLPAAAVKHKSKTDIAKAASAKKRKIEGDIFNFKADDDEDDYILAKSEPSDISLIKHETKVDIPPFARTPFGWSPEPSYLPATPLARMPTPYPFTPTYRPVTQPLRFSASQPMYHPTPQALLPSNSSFHAANQGQPIPTSRPKSSVTEDQISAAFEEFCKQDMFKPPVFDRNPSPQQPTTQRDTPQISPRTVETLAQPSAESQQPIPERPTRVIAPTTAVTPVDPPQSAGETQYILIAD